MLSLCSTASAASACTRHGVADGYMPQLTCQGVATSKEATVIDDRAADTGGNRHVQQDSLGEHRFETQLAERGAIGVVVCPAGDPERIHGPCGEWEVFPTTHVEGSAAALIYEVEWTSEGYSARGVGAGPWPCSLDNHAANAVCSLVSGSRPGQSLGDRPRFEQGDARLGAADVDAQSGHRQIVGTHDPWHSQPTGPWGTRSDE